MSRILVSRLKCFQRPFAVLKVKAQLEIGCLMQVLEYKWGDDISSLGPEPDVITGADIMYEKEHFPALLKTLQELSADHTVTFLAFRMRGEDLP